jgi:hypothetical protein
MTTESELRAALEAVYRAQCTGLDYWKWEGRGGPVACNKVALKLAEKELGIKRENSLYPGLPSSTF